MRATSSLLLALLAGCPDRTVAEVTPEQGRVEIKDLPAVPKGIDILFVIDDSLSMKEEQDSLRANFGRFIGVLESIEGGLPNVQIGVITPNLGTTAIDGTRAPTLAACTETGGDRGELRQLGAGGPRFLRDVERAGGGRETNYGALTLTQAFQQLATVGTSGCGVEQHLEATRRALDGNPVNAGFVRDDALLAVILIADEDDCSLARSTLFDGNRGDAAYPDIVNFRCTSQGVACETPATPLDMATGVRHDCHPREDATAVAPVTRYVEFLRTRKGNPKDVIVAGILGDPEPFAIVNKPGTTTKVLDRSCTYRNPLGGEQFAFPAVRTASFLSELENSARATICDDDLSDGLALVAELLRDNIVNECFKLPLLDADTAAPGLQADCAVTEVRRLPSGAEEQLRVIPGCETGRKPCWRIEEDPVGCSFTKIDPHLKFVVDRGSEPVGPDIRVKASCVTTESSGPFE